MNGTNISLFQQSTNNGVTGEEQIFPSFSKIPPDFWFEMPEIFRVADARVNIPHILQLIYPKENISIQSVVGQEHEVKKGWRS